ncbi:hypothetical protein V1503_18850 [Bacillus sp. SCS-151]|uniref:hypothetical protein n=1 Tax=Nanhaiella sioensis TaxID=3115293 RepID=UPI003979C9E8
MPTFNNLKELENYLSSGKGTDTLLNNDNIQQVLIKEAKRLEGYIKDELNIHFRSYQPKVYQRTGNTLASIYVTTPKKDGLYNWSIEIRFDRSLAEHPSVIGSDQPKGYTPWLLEVGWNIESKVGFSRPMFTDHPGTKYITKAIKKFNSHNSYGLKIEVETDKEKYM